MSAFVSRRDVLDVAANRPIKYAWSMVDSHCSHDHRILSSGTANDLRDFTNAEIAVLI